jgi:acyl-CoA thioester hydrolase
VNAWLIERGALDIETSEVIGLVVETGCHYFAPLTFPEPVTAALRVGHVGRSSVRYEVALFAAASEVAAAQGHFVHVYVHRDSRRPVSELPRALKRALEPLRAATTPEEAP